MRPLQVSHVTADTNMTQAVSRRRHEHILTQLGCKSFTLQCYLIPVRTKIPIIPWCRCKLKIYEGKLFASIWSVDCNKPRLGHWTVGCSLYSKNDLNFMGIKSSPSFIIRRRMVVELMVSVIGKRSPRWKVLGVKLCFEYLFFIFT